MHANAPVMEPAALLVAVVAVVPAVPIVSADPMGNACFQVLPPAAQMVAIVGQVALIRPILNASA